MGSDLFLCHVAAGVSVFQSTLPHGERHSGFLRGVFFVNRTISIHAPAWGAAMIFGGLGEPTPDFNPRSRMGSDFRDKQLRSRIDHFNPRSREGSDMEMIG